MKTKKLSRVIPFGFKESEEHGFLESIPAEVEALSEAKNYLKTCSFLLMTMYLQWLPDHIIRNFLILFL